MQLLNFYLLISSVGLQCCVRDGSDSFLFVLLSFYLAKKSDAPPQKKRYLGAFFLSKTCKTNKNYKRSCPSLDGTARSNALIKELIISDFVLGGG